eukprot:3947421-Amphidinium_carterae.1
MVFAWHHTCLQVFDCHDACGLLLREKRVSSHRYSLGIAQIRRFDVCLSCLQVLTTRPCTKFTDAAVAVDASCD